MFRDGLIKIGWVVYLGWPFSRNAKPGHLLQTAMMTR